MRARDRTGGAASRRVIEDLVIDLSLGKDPAGLHTMINPQFIERDGMQLEEEGCLSIPASPPRWHVPSASSSKV
jgi:peptide deformylase